MLYVENELKITVGKNFQNHPLRMIELSESFLFLINTEIDHKHLYSIVYVINQKIRILNWKFSSYLMPNLTDLADSEYLELLTQKWDT